MSTQKVRIVCATCGSEDVLADAYASWNVEDQRWEVEDTFSKGAHCRNCEGECRIEEAPFDPDAEDKADAQAAQRRPRQAGRRDRSSHPSLSG